MTMDELKKQISNIIGKSTCSAEFYFLIGHDDDLSVKSVDINHDDHNELADIFIQSLSDQVLMDDELTLLELSSADSRKDVIYRYDLDTIPAQLGSLKDIIETDDFEAFDISSDDFSNLAGILILLGDQDTQIALYKHQYPVSLLKKDSGGFNLMKPNGANRLKKLDSDILKINAKFEFFKINGQYYILDLKSLERFFGFHEAIKNVAKEGIGNIESTNLVMNCELFTDRLGDISFARKLVKSAKNSPVLGIIPNHQIISFTKTHPSLKSKFKYSDDGSQFNLKTKKSQELFLKLLNDDFLQSELTKQYYESIAKDNMEALTTVS
ncbi:anti-phage protein KwaB [uncultured Methylophaga sp.]|uniref:anti-phage protein KwaB n=1 Tax=uncultured Methylophaga sp. TaxID=285271 RepID=UPI002627B6E9|nr:anti-phage protein KwaB [uncultured Methylophaga sp.]